MKVSYNWLKEYLGDTAPSAHEIAELLTFKAFEIEEVIEKEDDTVIDVDVLPNRSSDCLCHRGIAREIATLTNVPLAHDPLTSQPELPATERVEITIEDKELCPRFTASVITGVKVGPSPDWLKKRLEVLGQRSINNIVDATNYVMLALGQPLHAYDADKFPQTDGVWRFGVRKAKEGEHVELIAEGGKDEERTVELKGGELLIIDESTGVAAGLAGVKGGRYAGVDEHTSNIIIEAAHFDPARTRTTARGLGIVIDASKRFENEPSRELPPYAQAVIAELIKDIADGTYEGTADVYGVPQESKDVPVRVERVNGLLGLSLTADEMRALLSRAGCSVTETEDGFMVTGPWERNDLNLEEDFIEEIGRVYGYEHVTAVVPPTVPLRELNVRHYYSEIIRDTLTSLGFSEVITSSFRKKDQIQLQNALASDKSYLRSTLIKNVNEALDLNAPNADLLGNTDTRVFEIGTVFEAADGEVREHVALALGVRIRQDGYSGKEDKVVTEATTAVSSALDTELQWNMEKGVAETNLSETFALLPPPTAYTPYASVDNVTYQPFSTYPYVVRDISLWVNEGTTADEVEEVLNAEAGDLRVRTTCFDEFTKDGRTSYAFRLIFQSDNKTLTDEEVNAIMEQVYKVVEEQNWEVR